MKLEGHLLDLVPYDARFVELEHKWENSEAGYWGDMGDRPILSREALRRGREEWLARPGPRDFVALGMQTKPGAPEPEKPLGGFYIGSITPHLRLAMLGAIIGEPDYWGGGYGTDALLLGVDYAFTWLDLRRVWLMTMSLNQRVLRQMAKVGFREEVRQREATLADGTLYDVVMFGMLRAEWPGYEAQAARLGLAERAAQVNRE